MAQPLVLGQECPHAMGIGDTLERQQERVVVIYLTDNSPNAPKCGHALCGENTKHFLLPLLLAWCCFCIFFFLLFFIPDM